MKPTFRFVFLLTWLLSWFPGGVTAGVPPAGPSSIEQMAAKGYALRFTDTVRCLQLQKAAIRAAQQQHRPADEAIAYAYLALTQRRLLNLQRFTEYVEGSWKIARAVKDTRAQAYAYWAMGSYRSYIDDKAAAAVYLLQAYRLFRQLQVYEHSSKIAAELSYCYSPGPLATIQQYASTAVREANKAGDSDSKLHAGLAMASYLTDRFREAGDTLAWQEAVLQLQQVIRMAEQDSLRVASKSNIAVAYLNLAVLYWESPPPVNIPAFLYHLGQAQGTGRQYGIKNVYRNALGLRGEYLISQGQYDQAGQLFREAISVQQRLPYPDPYLMVAVYGSLKRLASLQQDYAGYYRYDTAFTRYSQLQFNEKSQQLLQLVHARFDSDKKTATIRQLEQENRLQKQNTYLAAGIAAVLLAGLALGYRSYYFKRRFYREQAASRQQEQQNSDLKMQLLEKESLETLTEKLSLERRLLQSQMDPHFIFNALGNIQSMILQQKNEEAVRYLGKFSHLTRQVLEQSRQPLITLEEEISTLTHYMALQQLRFNDRFDYEVGYDPALSLQEQLPPLLIQPFVENAIEHGLKPLEGSRRGWLRIYFSLDTNGRMITCSVSDNGIGMAASRSRQKDTGHRSLSTRITAERLALMFGDEPGPAERVSYPDVAQATGCTVLIHIPFNHHV